jgi:hypothetical protein
LSAHYGSENEEMEEESQEQDEVEDGSDKDSS